MKILVTGANGQLGSELKYLTKKKVKSFIKGVNFTFIDIKNLDLGNSEAVKEYFTSNTFDYIINCAAYTAVDKAETEKDLAYLINSVSVKNIVSTLTEKTKFIHISTDYVFNGQSYSPYTEEMQTNPKSVYGMSKLMGESEALKHEKTIIIRTSWLYSKHGNNFVKTIHKLSKEKEELKVVFDQIGNPTYARDLAKAIIEILDFSIKTEDFKSGIYHFSNEGVCSWYDLAKEIINLNNSNCSIMAIETKDYPTPATRPFYSVLNKSKIKSEFNITIPHWKDSLINFFKEFKG